MEKQIRKIIYLIISLLCFGLLFYFCIILRIPRILESLIIVVLLFILAIVFFKEYEYEKKSIYLDETSKKIAELSKIYSTEKEIVDYVSDLMYTNLYKDISDNDSIVVIDYDESYLLNFYDNLDRLALNQNKEVDELTLVQKSACLIDSLLGTKAWVLKTIKYIDEINYSTRSLNIELAIKAGLLFCGHTIEEINESPSYIDFLTTVLHEVIEFDRVGDLMVINILVDILQNYNQ